MANLRSKINLIQKALLQKGVVIMVTRKQIYLKEKQCVCTKYILTTPHEYEINGETKTKINEIFSSFSQVETVKFLASKLKEVQNG